MRKTARNLFYAAFTLFFLLFVLALEFFFFYNNAPLFSQAFYWGNKSYNAGIHSVKVENGKTFVSLKICENNPSQTLRYKDDSVPPIEMYLMAFGRQYFGRKPAVERGRITFEFDLTGIPDIIFVHAAGQYNDFETHISFDGKTKKPVRFFIPPENAVDPHTLLNQKKLRVNASGYSREYVSTTFENISGTTLLIKSGVGTWFKNSDKNFQNMALTAGCAFIAEPGKTYALILPAVCLNKGRKVPEEHNVFTVERFDDSERLVSVLRELSLSNLVNSEIENKIWAVIESDIKANRRSAWH